MLLFTQTTGTLSEGQIQRNFHKLAFKLSGAKATNVTAGAQFLADAGSTYVTLKRISSLLGEKTVWARMTLKELFNASMGIQGYGKATGTDAATAYTAEFAMEINLHENIDISGGDYLALTVENTVSGLTVYVSGLAAASKGHNHLKIERVAFQANEQKKVDVGGADYVVIPASFVEAKGVGLDIASLTADSLDKYLYENSTFLVNTTTGLQTQPDAAVLAADFINYLEVTAGASAGAILIIRQTEY